MMCYTMGPRRCDVGFFGVEIPTQESVAKKLICVEVESLRIKSMEWNFL